MDKQSASERIGHLLRRAQHALRTATDRALRVRGLSAAQYTALTGLEAGPLSGAELARRCLVSPQTMNEIVVTLHQRGLLDRRAHASHGRVLEAALTNEGRAILAESHHVVHSIEERMVAELDRKDRRRLTSALHACAIALEARDSATAPPSTRPSA